MVGLLKIKPSSIPRVSRLCRNLFELRGLAIKCSNEFRSFVSFEAEVTSLHHMGFICFDLDLLELLIQGLLNKIGDVALLHPSNGK